jgi:hypothetical protein
MDGICWLRRAEGREGEKKGGGGVKLKKRGERRGAKEKRSEREKV